MGKDFYMFPSLEIGTYCNGPWLDWKMKYGYVVVVSHQEPYAGLSTVWPWPSSGSYLVFSFSCKSDHEMNAIPHSGTLPALQNMSTSPHPGRPAIKIFSFYGIYREVLVLAVRAYPLCSDSTSVTS